MKTCLTVLITATLAMTAFAAQRGGSVRDPAGVEKLKSDFRALKIELELIQNLCSELETKNKKLLWICQKKGVDVSSINNADFWPKPVFRLPLAVGQKAYCKYTTKIIQIIDPQNMIAEMAVEYQSGNLISTEKKTFWVKGIPIAGHVDGNSIKINSVMKISETTTYSTALGGTNTIFVLEPDAEFKDW